MVIGIILFIIILMITVLFIRINYKKCETNSERILFILYIIIVMTPIVIYYLDLWNIPSNLKLTKNIESQNWLSFLANYTSSIISAVIGSTVSIYLVFFQIRKNNEDNDKRDKENLRIQNMPLIKYNCIKDTKSDIRLTQLDTNFNNDEGVTQSLNFSLKNIGLNTVRKIYIKIKSDILEKEYDFDLNSQGILEKEQEVIIPFVLRLVTNRNYNFEITVYYQDLLFNVYEQNILLSYELFYKNDGLNYYFNSKFDIEDEKKINELPQLEFEKL